MRERIGIIVWFAGVLFMGLATTGCQRQPADGAIRFGVPNLPENFDPRFASDAISSRVNRLLYARLVDFDSAWRPVPALATWTRLGPRHYRFHLKPKRRDFSNGDRLTSADVVATYRSILDENSGSPHRIALGNVRALRALDIDTLDLLLKRPDPLAPALLVHGILPARLLAEGHDFRARPVGSGPFALEPGADSSQVSLRRRADDLRLRFVRVADPLVRVMKLGHGEIDLLQNDLPPELVGWLASRPGLSMQRAAGGNFSYLGFNLDDEATGDPRVRRAIASAIDREAVRHYLFQDHVRLASGLLPPEHWAGYRGAAGFQYDPALARRLLADAGYDDEHPLHLVYKTSSDPFRLRIATIIQAQLRGVGVDVDIASHDWGTFFGDIKAGRFQLYSLAWVGVNTPDIFRYVFHSESLPPHGANRGRLRDTRVDALIEQAERQPDMRSAAASYRRLQQRLLALLPYVPLWYEDQYAFTREDIAGYRVSRDGRFDALARVRRVKQAMPDHGR